MYSNYPKIQQALTNYNHSQWLFNNLPVDADDDLVQSIIYQLRYDQKKLDEAINKYRSKQQENSQLD